MILKKKKIPMRMCTGCLEMKPKKELIRIVKTPDGNVVVDTTGKQSGRGAYICRNKECLEKSFKTKKLNKSLNTAISDEIFNKLRDEVLDAE